MITLKKSGTTSRTFAARNTLLARFTFDWTFAPVAWVDGKIHVENLERVARHTTYKGIDTPKHSTL